MGIGPHKFQPQGVALQWGRGGSGVFAGRAVPGQAAAQGVGEAVRFGKQARTGSYGRSVAGMGIPLAPVLHKFKGAA